MAFDINNIGSHWIQAHGETGDVMNQKVMDGPNTVLDTTIEVAGTDAGVDLNSKLIV